MDFLKGFFEGISSTFGFIWDYKWYIISAIVILGIIKGVSYNKKNKK